MNILGLHFGHDAGIAVLSDGLPMVSLIRERHNRAKPSPSSNLSDCPPDRGAHPFVNAMCLMNYEPKNPQRVDLNKGCQVGWTSTDCMALAYVRHGGLD